MSAQIPAVLVTETDGIVVSQNRAARRLLGRKTGEYCWDAFDALQGAEGLPCRRGCALRLLASGVESAQYASFSHDGQRHQLACVPVEGRVVCTLSHGTGERAEAWQTLTPRELTVLELLASGETTASAAACLGLSESTIRTHVEKMRVKFGVNTRAAIVANGFRYGYLD